jgi:hypothetical protein
MNVEQYMEMGILESYVMGITSTEDSADVECLAIANPSIQQELEAIRAVFEFCALQRQREPPVFLKNQIIDELVCN